MVIKRSGFYGNALPAAAASQFDAFVQFLQRQRRACEFFKWQPSVILREEIKCGAEMLRRVIVDPTQGEAFAQHRLAGKVELCLGMHHARPNVMSAGTQSFDAFGNDIRIASDFEYKINGRWRVARFKRNAAKLRHQCETL